MHENLNCCSNGKARRWIFSNDWLTAVRFIIPRLRDRWFKSSPRNQFSRNCGVLSRLRHPQSPSNFLLLDEPTNHLDVDSRGVLIDAVQGYEGNLVLAASERTF